MALACLSEIAEGHDLKKFHVKDYSSLCHLQKKIPFMSTSTTFAARKGAMGHASQEIAKIMMMFCKIQKNSRKKLRISCRRRMTRINKDLY